MRSVRLGARRTGEVIDPVEDAVRSFLCGALNDRDPVARKMGKVMGRAGEKVVEHDDIVAADR